LVAIWAAVRIIPGAMKKPVACSSIPLQLIVSIRTTELAAARIVGSRTTSVGN
jgi:hypothetical protein